MKDAPTFDVNQQGNITVVDVDTETTTEQLGADFIEHLIQLLDDENPEKLVINFDYADWMTNPMVSGLLEVQESMSENSKLKLCRMNADSQHACRFLNLSSTVFDIHDSLESALESFADSDSPTSAD